MSIFVLLLALSSLADVNYTVLGTTATIPSVATPTVQLDLWINGQSHTFGPFPADTPPVTLDLSFDPPLPEPFSVSYSASIPGATPVQAWHAGSFGVADPLPINGLRWSLDDISIVPLIAADGSPWAFASLSHRFHFQSVPEPSGLVTMLMACGLLLNRRLRRR